MTTKPATKRPEIVLATWANSKGAAHFGDRRFQNDGSCDSMWLSLRVVDDDSFTAYKLRGTMSNLGLWIWWSNSNDSVSVEFKAHDVHSATVSELEAMVSELRRLNKRVPQRLHGQSYSDYVIATLRAVGIKRIVEYRGIGVKDEYSSLANAFGELQDEIEARSKVAA